MVCSDKKIDDTINTNERNSSGRHAKKIGIITLDGNYNYGNRLQLYAVSEIYKKYGYLSENIVVSNAEPRTAADILTLLLQGREASNPQLCSSKERLEAFGRFNKKIKIRRFQTIKDIPCDEYVYFSVGSDQVWNPGLIQDRSSALPPIRPLLRSRDRKWKDYLLEWYFLGFCDRNKRIALAPSIGIDSLDNVQSQLIKQGASQFNIASVREEAGADLIEKLTGCRPTVICDPTFVLDASDWRRVSSDLVTPKRPYIFTYLLGGVGGEASEVLAELVNNSPFCEIVPLSDRQKPGEPNAGPAEFISLIDNASHVVTDSFHAAAFASMLRTPQTIVHRAGGVSMFSRLNSLAKRLGIQHMVYGSSEYDPDRLGDYQDVEESIGRLRSEFLEYVQRAL